MRVRLEHRRRAHIPPCRAGRRGPALLFSNWL